MSPTLLEGIEAQIVGGLFVLMAGVPFYLWFNRYLHILDGGGAPEGSEERKAYDDLSASLNTNGKLIYANKLRKALAAADRFFGDAKSVGQRAFGMKTPAPLWTAPAFDRCLLLALLYPIATIYIVWAMFGHVGPAEALLRLPLDLVWWKRAASVVALGLSVLGYVRARSARDWPRRAWLLAGAVGLVGAGGFAFSFGISLVFGIIACIAETGAISGVVGVVLGAGFAFGLAAIYISVYAFAFSSIVGFFVLAIVIVLDIRFRGQGTLHRFLSAFILVAATFCFLAARYFSQFTSWSYAGPLLLFMGLLTLVNAPFDWLSRGLTRALLRRGLECEKWWPYVYALADAFAAVVIIALLACTMVVSVQAFDELAVRGGGKSAAILPLDVLFRGIEDDPWAPEYYWVYLLLFSTMIPSLINLTIGGLSLVRGIPIFSTYLYRMMPEGKPVPGFNRQIVAASLMAQWISGVVFAFAAQGILFFGLLGYVMPFLGFEILKKAKALADFDIPGHVFALFGV